MADTTDREHGPVTENDMPGSEKSTVHTTTDPDSTALDHDAADLEGGPEKAEAADEGDPNVVDWDSPNDPEDPKQWPDNKKWLNISILSLLTLVT